MATWFDNQMAQLAVQPESATGAMVQQPVAAPTPTAPTGTAPMSGLPDGFSLTGANNLASFSAPGLLAPFTQQFQGVTPQTISTSPAYQFRLNEGLDALQRSAASRGTLLTGGTLKDLTAFAQGLASTEYDNEWQRQLGLYDRTRDIYNQNKTSAYNMLQGASNIGQDAASSYAANVGNLYTSGANANAQAAASKGAGWANTFGDLAELGTAIARDKFGTRYPMDEKLPFDPMASVNKTARSIKF